MDRHESEFIPAANEADLLRFLCDPGVAVTQRTKLAAALANYCWRDNDHRILFEAIGELLVRNSQNIIEHLPAELTRRGFPDISCHALSASSSLRADAALALAEHLLRASQ